MRPSTGQPSNPLGLRPSPEGPTCWCWRRKEGMVLRPGDMASPCRRIGRNGCALARGLGVPRFGGPLDLCSGWLRSGEEGPKPYPDIALLEPLAGTHYLHKALSDHEQKRLGLDQGIYRIVRDTEKVTDTFRLFGRDGETPVWVYLGEVEFPRPRKTHLRLLTGPAAVVDTATQIVLIVPIIVWNLGAFAVEEAREGEDVSAGVFRNVC